MIRPATPFDSLAPWQAGIVAFALAVIVVNVVWTAWLYLLARRNQSHRPTVVPASSDDFLWVFMVPALDEAVTIADSVQRLIGVRCRQRRIVVIDDGSTDATPDILAAISSPDLLVVRRDPPNARRGKAAALNDAWARLPDIVEDLDPMRTIVCIVDADGRLDPDAPDVLAGRFADDRVGGVQVRVRIYNDDHPLTRAQDIEFGIFGKLYQAARTELGTAGMGGNGQFNRLATLDELAGAEVGGSGGPWRDRLTEDQDIGLRMLEHGWRCEHDNRTTVEQQGLSSLRKLLRQRTRWAQGNLQAMGHLRLVLRAPNSRRARLDLVLYLLQPLFLAVAGLAFGVAIFATVIDDVDLIPESLWYVVLAFVLAFSGIVLGCIARTGRGPHAWVAGGLIAVVYVAYTWLLWPAFFRASWRQVRSETTWAKTEREAIPVAS